MSYFPTEADRLDVAVGEVLDERDAGAVLRSTVMAAADAGDVDYGWLEAEVQALGVTIVEG